MELAPGGAGGKARRAQRAQFLGASRKMRRGSAQGAGRLTCARSASLRRPGWRLAGAPPPAWPRSWRDCARKELTMATTTTERPTGHRTGTREEWLAKRLELLTA